MLKRKRIAVGAITFLLATTGFVSPASARSLRRYHKPTSSFVRYHRAPRASRSALAPRPQVSWESVKERIATCESGGRYDARNRRSSASGKYQFLNSTWAGRFGVKRAYLATPEQQEQAAADLHAVAGLRPWSSSQRCWGPRLFKGDN